jgi:hypothetical protein
MDADHVNTGRDAEGGRRERRLESLISRQIQDPAEG